MSKPFQRIAVIGKHHTTPLHETLSLLIRHLQDWHCEFTLETETATEAGFSSLPTQSLEEISQACDLVITIGGDGNLLRTARQLCHTSIALIGINKGQLGYLTDIHPEALMSLKDILRGEYSSEERFLLRSHVFRGEDQLFSQIALNDVVLSPGEIAQMIEFELYIDGNFVYRQRSDGLIISTPTGSTAYSLSAGGPILHPGINAIVLTPMLPHTLTSRPIVVSAESAIDIYLSEANRTQARLNHDGQEQFSLQVGDRIHLEKFEKPIRLVHPKTYNYFHALQSKLHWNQQPIFTDR